MMMTLFDEEYIQRAYGAERYAEGEAKGEAKKEKLFVNNLRVNGYTDEQIAAMLGLSLEKVRTISEN